MEMGCGSGIISMHLAKTGCLVTAADVDPEAVRNSEENSRANGLKVRTLLSDLFSAVEGEFELIVFNPPYLRGSVREQEDLCWAGGRSGLEVTIEFLRGAGEHLAPGGRVIVLVSSDADEDELSVALEGWKSRELASRTIFFEQLKVLELTL